MNKRIMHLVWNVAMTECWGTDSAGDAQFVSTGDASRCRLGVPATGGEFRETHEEDAPDGVLPMTTLEIPLPAVALTDAEIDTSDIPEQGEESFKRAKRTRLRPTRTNSDPEV